MTTEGYDMNLPTQIENLPDLKLLLKGEQYKVYQVSGQKGMRMPQHISTHEAILIVLAGSARLDINNTSQNLIQGDVFVIPGCVMHSLTIEDKFKSLVIMDLTSSIEFTN